MSKLSSLEPFLACAVLATALSACSSSGDGPRGSVLGRSLESLTSLSGRGREERNAALIDSGTTAVADTESTAYMDRQEADLRAQLEPRGFKVERAGNHLVLTLPSAVAFDPNREELKRAAQPLIGQVAGMLKRYDRTTVDVYGHTDSGGDEKRNLELTQRRALSVARYLAGQGIDAKRLSVTGFGGSRPVGSNDKESGRQENRRIEIQISPVTRA